MKQTKRHVMWRIVRMRRILDVSDLQELAGVSEPYAYEFLNLLLQNRIVKKLPGGKYQLRKDTIELPFEVTLHYAKKDLPLVKTDRLEDTIWGKIIALSKDGKEFLYEDVINPAIAIHRFYVAALVKAGYIKKQYKKGKKKDGSPDNRARYRLVKNTGKHAPILGRTIFLWDRNIDTIWYRPPFNLDKYLEKKK